ncbi:MAG: diguanylate cyclase domain-containing protein [Fusobacteriota bacterium]
MKLKEKVFNFTIILIMTIILALFIFVKFHLEDLFLDLEKQYIHGRVIRVEKMIENDLKNLKHLVLDWAIWDDTRDFILNGDEDYINSNMGITTYLNTNINFIGITDLNKKPLFLENFDLEEKKETPFDREILDFIEDKDNESKIIYLEESQKIAYFSYSKVYNSNKTSNPVGYFLMGYYINESILADFKDRIRVQFYFDIEEENDDMVYYDRPNKNYTYSKKVITNLDNDLKVVAIIKTERWIYKLLNDILTDATIFIIIILMLGYFGIRYGLNKFMIYRIENLENQVLDITKDFYPGKRVTEIKNDEIGILGNVINKLLDKIEDMKEKITLSQQKYKGLYEETAALHLIIGDDFNIKNVNRSVEKLLKYSKNELINKNIRKIVLKKDFDILSKFITDSFLGNKTDKKEITFVSKDNKKHIIIVAPTELQFYEDGVYSILLTGIDITERKKAENKLERYATIDDMTGVYNRRVGFEILEDLVEKYENDSDKNNFAVCYIDINNLKVINDKKGHQKGDEMILSVVDILKDITRDEDRLIRLGGDEFLIVLPGFTKDIADKFWKRVEEKVKNINTLGIFDFKISISHGYAFYTNQDPKTVDQLLEVSDRRMYKEKKEKKKQKI